MGTANEAAAELLVYNIPKPCTDPHCVAGTHGALLHHEHGATPLTDFADFIGPQGTWP